MRGHLKAHGGRFVWCLCVAVIVLSFSNQVRAQTASTGALMGITLDRSGAVLPGVLVQLKNAETSVRSFVSDENGCFGFTSLPPGAYELKATKTDFRPFTTNVQVHVTETVRIEFRLNLAKVLEHMQVSVESSVVQLDSSASGRVVNKEAISRLPMVSRNFAQIASLSPGVITGVSNAGELGLGGTALSQIGKSSDGIYVHGARSYDNNWQLDGISVVDVMSSGSASGGIPTPNPDTIEEFKVQTALYDATFGRGTGASITVITRKGTNEPHGSAFEAVRNNVLNANDFFMNQTGQPRADLKQNQFGFALGAPILRDRLSFFSSYQGTRQINGLAAGQSRVGCTVSLSEPPLTNDRSAAALGRLFGGMTGELGGISIAPDGSNINPVALALLNFKLPDGSYLVPTPQTVNSTKPFATQGFSVFSHPCEFNEDQGLLNMDYTFSPKSQLATRFFMSNSDLRVTFPGNGRNSGNISGFTSPGTSQFVVFSLADTHSLSQSSLNEVRIGYLRIQASAGAEAPFRWSDVGVVEGTMNENNELPSLNISGSLSMASAFPRTYTQNSFVLGDTFTRLKGAHDLRMGGSVTQLRDYLNFAGFGSFVQFLSWPDFLLGLNANGNGTGTFSNLFQSADAFGLLNREFRAWEGSAFVQDDSRIIKSLTLNLGLRYERVGQFGDDLGRNSSFDFSKADRDPPAAGSLDGYVVASNFQGPVPSGVTRATNTFGTYGEGQNTIAPRVGFAWQILPNSDRLALRGGYGIYYSRPTGQAFTSSVLSAPFGLTRVSTGLANADAAFQAPFAQPFPTPDSFPLFTSYSPTTHGSVNALAPNLRPAMVQQFSLNLQTELHGSLLLEVGYVGSRGTHLQRFRSLDQALNASVANPVNGITSNTIANIQLRVPVPGIAPDSLRVMESEGSSWYNGLEVSLTKRLSHGLQFLLSYTFSKTLDTDASEVNGISANNTIPLGDQNSPSQRWGRSSIDRTHRLVFSTTWAMPAFSQKAWHAALGGWEVAAVVVLQSGTALTIADMNANNVFGISEDRAQLSGICSKDQLETPGALEGRLNNYFNKACFTTPLVIGADGIGTGFGNSGTGIATGPGETNVDFAVSKTFAVSWLREKSSIQFRAEFFNALNHPQFANPDSNFTSPTFGVISATSVNARVGQLALRLSF